MKGICDFRPDRDKSFPLSVWKITARRRLTAYIETGSLRRDLPERRDAINNAPSLATHLLSKETGF
jgi:hypothetical protein